MKVKAIACQIVCFFKSNAIFYKIYPIYTIGDTKQSTPISVQIIALRLKLERISFCDRFRDIKRKPTLKDLKFSGLCGSKKVNVKRI